MSLKERLINIKLTLMKKNKNKSNNIFEEIALAKKEMENINDYFLNDNIENFLKWYTLLSSEIDHTALCDERPAKRINNFINKMVAWYELRYPDFYVISLFSDKYKSNYSEWKDIFDRDVFFSLLTDEEKNYLRIPDYPETIHLGKNSNIHFSVTKKGILKDAEIRINENSEAISLTEMVKGLSLEECQKVLYKNEIISEEDNKKISDIILKYNSQFDIRDGVLNCVMYKIIENGENDIGAKRAFLFAQEFQRNINIPMSYGYSDFDANFRFFANEYLKAGGSQKLMCYTSYFSQRALGFKAPLGRLLKNHISNITEEEKKLYTRLIYALEEGNVSQKSTDKIFVKK